MSAADDAELSLVRAALSKRYNLSRTNATLAVLVEDLVGDALMIKALAGDPEWLASEAVAKQRGMAEQAEAEARASAQTLEDARAKTKQTASKGGASPRETSADAAALIAEAEKEGWPSLRPTGLYGRIARKSLRVADKAVGEDRVRKILKAELERRRKNIPD